MVRLLLIIPHASLNNNNNNTENAEASGLDNIDRRFAWFRRMLGRHEVEQGRVFPEEWKVGWALVGGFVDVTR